MLEQALAEDRWGKWSAFEVGLDVPRQNGKSAILEARILAGLFLFDEPLIVYCSHLFDTSVEVMRRLVGWIDGCDWMRRRVKLTRAGEVGKWSHGEEGIELLNGNRVRFKTRTKGGGRGLSGECVLLDEAMYLTDAHVSALMPMMAAKSVTGNPQLWYAGSAGDEESLVFGRVRDRALARNDPSLCWLEYSVDEHAYAAAAAAGADELRAFATNPAHIAQANPGLDIRISVDHCLREQRSMDPGEYAKERLGVGRWPVTGAGSGPISVDQWRDIEDPDSAPLDPVVLAMAVSVDGSRSAIGTAGRRADGLRHVEVIDHRAGVHWLPERLVQLRDDHHPVVIVTNAAGRAGSLVPTLVEAGLVVHSGREAPPAGSLVLMSGPDVAAAFGAFVSAVTEAPTTLRHRPNPEFPPITTALQAATTRWVGQAQAWDGKNLADISALEALTLAAYGHAKYGHEQQSWGFFE